MKIQPIPLQRKRLASKSSPAATSWADLVIVDFFTDDTIAGSIPAAYIKD
jgi:hypothetical protein